MAVNYHVYENDGHGGPVDYSTVVATVSALTWTSSALTFPGDYTFAVRAFDTVSGFEESNADARIRLILDASGVDITNRPSPPDSLVAIPTAGATATVHWHQAPGGNPVTNTKVWATVGGTVNYAASPNATVPYTGPNGTATLTGLTDGVSYSVGVRAVNGTGDDGNTTVVATLVADGTGPGAVDSLAATVGARGA